MSRNYNQKPKELKTPLSFREGVEWAIVILLIIIIAILRSRFFQVLLIVAAILYAASILKG